MRSVKLHSSSLPDTSIITSRSTPMGGRPSIHPRPSASLVSIADSCLIPLSAAAVDTSIMTPEDTGSARIISDAAFNSPSCRNALTAVSLFTRPVRSADLKSSSLPVVRKTALAFSYFFGFSLTLSGYHNQMIRFFAPFANFAVVNNKRSRIQ